MLQLPEDQKEVGKEIGIFRKLVDARPIERLYPFTNRAIAAATIKYGQTVLAFQPATAEFIVAALTYSTTRQSYLNLMIRTSSSLT